jgi:hypothetical protein
MPNIELQHRTIADLSKPPANIPTGVWELRAIKLSSKDVTMKTKEGEEYETVEYLLSLEPIAPTKSVNPDELAAIDPRTGKPAYDGKRLFLRFTESYRPEMQSLGSALAAMGFSENDSFDEIVENNGVKGRKVFGEVFNRDYKRNDGTEGTEQKVRTWSAKGGSEAFAI